MSHTPSATTTVDRLREIPDLAAQVYVSRDTPHRPGRPTSTATGTAKPGHVKPHKGSRGSTSESPMPAVVAAYDILARAELEYLIEACVAVRDDMDTPTDMPAPRWAEVCADLIGLREWWESDDVLLDFVGDAAGKAHRALRRWVGESRPPRLACPKCGGKMREIGYGDAMESGTNLRCSDCGTILGAKDVAHEATMRTPAPLTDIAAMFAIPLRTVQRWAANVEAATDHEPSPKRPALYLPEKFEPLVESASEDGARVVPWR